MNALVALTNELSRNALRDRAIGEQLDLQVPQTRIILALKEPVIKGPQF